MIHKKKITAFSALAIFVVMGTASTRLPQHKRNLKVLPEDISDQKLDSIMQSYNKALGVTCNFCHSPATAVFPVVPPPGALDYTLDNQMKETAREMMRMTIYINKTYFYFDKTTRPEYLKVITCKTCHQGEPFPPED